MKISFVLLAHEEPDSLRILIETLLASGSDVYVHHDLNSPHNLRESAKAWRLDRLDGKLFHAKRVKVAWGEWSIVQATLNCLDLAQKQGFNADYFMLLSGSCMPVKPIRLLEDFLKKHTEIDFIEVVNAWQKQWVTGGIQYERWESFHYVNWRSNPELFDLSLKLQKKLNIKRKLPLKHTPYMGSQWWCLRTTTVDSILALIKKHPKLIRFYRRTWVPDELFFQTMVGNLVTEEQTSAEILTRYKFNSWGVPRVYYDDDLPELLAENTFLARKISHRAKHLRQSLSNICSLPEADYQHLLNDQQNEYAVSLRKRLLFQKQLKDQAWFALVTSNENEYDYIKSIPNPMLVVVSSNEKIRNLALTELKKLSDSVVFGNLLDKNTIDFGKGIESFAGYKNSSTKLAQNRWHLFLGEIAFHAKKKTVIFSLGDESLPYLTVLRWKTNLSVIVLDGEFSDGRQNELLASIYTNSQVSHLLGADSRCRFVRLPFALFKESTRAILSHPCTVEDYSYKLVHLPVQSAWPSLRSKTHDRYDFLKSIPNPMIIVYAAEEKSARFISEHIQRRSDVCVFHDVFKHVPPDRKQTDWHYYLGDLAHLAEEKLVVFSLDPKHVFYLETLRWKWNLAVIILDDKPAATIGLEFVVADLRKLKAKETENHNARVELNKLLSDKHCQTYYLETDRLMYVDEALEKFTNANMYDYIKSIPNPMVLVVSSIERIRQQALAELKKLPDSVTLGNLSNALESLSGYRPEKWHLFLGELALQNQLKTLVFSIGDESLQYLTVLRWKKNLTVIVLDSECSNVNREDFLNSIYTNSQASHIVGSDSYCRLARLPIDLFKETTYTRLTRACRIDDYSYSLANMPSRTAWPSMRSKIRDRYDFLKSIPNPMIIVYAAEEKTAHFVSNLIQNRPGFCVYHDMFKHVPTDRKQTDWHYFLGDLAHLAEKNTVVLSLYPEHIFYLETLRWKNNLAVFVMDENPVGADDLEFEVTGLQRIKAKKTKSYNARNEIIELLRDKHCQSYFLEPHHITTINAAVDNFISYINKLEADKLKIQIEACAEAGVLLPRVINS